MKQGGDRWNEGPLSVGINKPQLRRLQLCFPSFVMGFSAEEKMCEIALGTHATY
jgi:hypothetical protein